MPYQLLELFASCDLMHGTHPFDVQVLYFVDASRHHSHFSVAAARR